MSGPPEYFARVAGGVNLPLLQGKLVVVVGIGTVGSQIANELAKSGIGRFRLIDGDHLEEVNRARHVLPERYVGMNKAEAMTLFLADEVPQSRPEAVPLDVNEALSDRQLDELLEAADLIVAATDDREAQRRIGERALSLSVPAIFPALYGDEGGEVIVQTDPQLPCFLCWDGFRTNQERLRGVTALNATTLPVIYIAVRLSLGILDPSSVHRRMMVRGPNEPPNQMFEPRGLAAPRMAPLTRRPNCPSCGVGPAPVRAEAELVPRPDGWGQVQPQPQGRSETDTRSQDRSNSTLFVAAGVVVAVILLVTLMSSNNKSSVSASSEDLPPAEISKPYNVKVNYSQSLASMISAAHLQQAREGTQVTEQLFPATSGRKDIEVVLIHLTDFKKNDNEAAGAVEGVTGEAYLEAENSLSQLGYRPATLPELLAFSEQYPEISNNPGGIDSSSVVVELGSLSPASNGERGFCEVFGPYVQLQYTGGGFNQTTKFLAVHT